MIDRYFKLAERRTSVRVEIVAGVTTFLTMAYIIFVNPAILADAGMDKTALVAVTCLIYCMYLNEQGYVKKKRRSGDE